MEIRNLFCERRERILVFVHNLVGYFHGPLEVGIVRHCLKPAASEFCNMQFLATLEIEPLHQFAGKQKTVGVSDLFDFDFHWEIVLLVWAQLLLRSFNGKSSIMSTSERRK